jgi:LPS-assembly lipoprotein
MKLNHYYFLNAQLRKRISVTTLITLILLLVSCGFQMRGAYQLPAAMQTTYVDTSALVQSSTLSRVLIRRLKASDIKISNVPSANVAILKLLNEHKTKRIISVDSIGRAREYTLTYAISFNVKALDAEFEIADQEVRIDRDFVFDTQDVLGNSREESRLYEEMRVDVIRLIMLRLQSQL